MRQDLKFLREYFSIPKSAKVCWGLIEEKLHHEEVALRPGLIVAKRRNGNEKIYLDIAQRRFYTEIELCEVSRKIYPAQRKCRSNCDIWIADNGLNARRGKGWVEDIYYPAVYNENFKNELLL